MTVIKKSKAAFVHFLPIFGFIFLNLLGGSLCSVITGDPILGTLLGDIIIIFAGGFWYRYMVVPFHDEMVDMSVKTALFYTAVLAIVYVGSQVGSLWVGVIFPGTLETFHSNVQMNISAYFLLTVFIAPVAEELLFRGACYTQMRKVFGPIPACLLSTALFAFLHSTPSQVYLSMMCGLLFCVVYELTGRILYSVALHFMYNVLCMIVGNVPVSNLALAFLIQIATWVVIFSLYVKVIHRAHHKLV